MKSFKNNCEGCVSACGVTCEEVLALRVVERSELQLQSKLIRKRVKIVRLICLHSLLKVRKRRFPEMFKVSTSPTKSAPLY